MSIRPLGLVFYVVDFIISFPYFGGHSYLAHELTSLDQPLSRIVVSIKTKAANGTILYTEKKGRTGMHLYIIDGLLGYQLRCGQHNTMNLYSAVKVNTGILTSVYIQ